MAVSNADIQNWFSNNAGASDATIAAAMNQYGVTPEQMAQATGLAVDDVSARYTKANNQNSVSARLESLGGKNLTQADYMNQTALNGWMGESAGTPYNSSITNEQITSYLSKNPSLTDQQIATTMLSYGVSPWQVADATGTNVDDINLRFTNALRSNASLPALESLSQPTALTNTPTVTPRPTNPLLNQDSYPSSSVPALSNNDFTVNEIKTAALADKNNPLVRQAMARAMQSMNGRGLLNSSMATQAAQEAAISKALEIAAPDTAAYYTDQRDAKQFGYQSQLNQQGYDHTKDMAGINFGYQSQLNQQGYDHTKDMAGINFGYQSQLNQQGYGNQEYMARLNNDLSIANSQAQYDMKVGDVTQTNYITMIDRIQQDTTKQVQQINSSAMPYEEKQAAIRNIQSQAQAQIDNANRLFKSTNGWQDQWAVAADTYSWQVEGAPEKPASTTTTSERGFNTTSEWI